MSDQAFNQFSTLYVGDLCKNVTEEQLHDIFSTHEKVHSVRIIKQSRLKRFNYAFVNFFNFCDALLAKNRMNCQVINGNPIRVSWQKYNLSSLKSGFANICVSNLCSWVDPKILFNMFSKFGKISSCKVAFMKLGPQSAKVSRCYGYVQYESEWSAEAAIARTNGKEFWKKKLHVSKCVPVAENQLPSSICYKFYNEAAKSNIINAHGVGINYPKMNSCSSFCYQCVDKFNAFGVGMNKVTRSDPRSIPDNPFY